MTEFLTQWHTAFFDPERIPFVIAALLLTVIAGMITGPLAGTGNANPLSWIVFDTIFGKLGGRLNKTRRPKADLIFRGFLFSAFALLIAVMLAKLSGIITTGSILGSATEVILLSFCFSAGAIWFALLRLYFAMEKEKQKGGKGAGVYEGAYFAIARSTRSNLSIADEYTITRTGMGFAARGFDKALVAPALWYLIAGIEGALIYCVLASLSWRFGKEGFSKGFGIAPLALEKLMGFVPSIISGILITLAGLFTPTAKLHKGLAAWMGYKSRSPYEQGGLPLSALAWSLNLSLGGHRQDITGSAIKAEWVGPEKASAQCDYKHLRRAIYINVIAHILFLAMLLGLYVWSGILSA